MAKQTIETEVVVLGSGPGGYSAAFRAADLGKKVTLVERYESLGGVCLNVGCIPSKALLHTAKVIEDAKDMEELGVSFGKPKIDTGKILEWKQGIVDKLTGGLTQLAKRRNVEVVHGEGKFLSKNEIGVGDITIEFEQAIIAAGSRAVELPFIPEDPRIMTSTGALMLEDTNCKMLVLGGGIIGLEMATVYYSLGTTIDVVEFMDQLIPGVDKDIVKVLHKHVESRYNSIMLGTKVTKVEAKKEGLLVTFEGENAPGKPELYDRILVAVGRVPNGDLIDADKAGVVVDEEGFIPVDDQQKTNVENIYAIGDIVGQPMLAHKAMPEGRLAAEVIAGKRHYFDAKCIPSFSYTDPEVAWVGVTETEAKEKGIDYGRGTFPWAASGRALGMARTEGMTKLIFNNEDKKLIGAAIVGVNAGELIGEMSLAIEMGADAEDIALTVHAHPTLSETMMLSSEAFEGTITDLYLPKRKKK
ncbi:MAG: dihydrolipoyl dehydrogenase [Flavobacteriales bacterium]|nr:dihydrolipoyl dehydrogenase [Flavobacteriales bacterium]